MATITIRTDMHTDVMLEKLEKAHSSSRIKKNTIIKAAIQAFAHMNEEEREKYLNDTRRNDGRRVRPSIW